MKTFLMRVFGLAYPSVYHALNHSTKECVRVAYDSYCVKNSAGLAEAINHYVKTNYDMVSSNDRNSAADIRVHLLAGAKSLQYPCVVWVSDEGLESLPVSYNQAIGFGD